MLITLEKRLRKKILNVFSFLYRLKYSSAARRLKLDDLFQSDLQSSLDKTDPESNAIRVRSINNAAQVIVKDLKNIYSKALRYNASSSTDLDMHVFGGMEKLV